MALPFISIYIIMLPIPQGASDPTPASSAYSDDDKKEDRTPPSAEQKEFPSPRMVQQYSPEFEEDWVALDYSDDDTSIEDRNRTAKRGRDTGDDAQDAYSEPRFKRLRRSADSSLHKNTDQHPESSSLSSSSSSTSSASTSTSSNSSTSLPTAQLIRKTLDRDAAGQIVGGYGGNLKIAAPLLFGESTSDWPDGYSLLQIPILSPAMEQPLTDSGICILWHGSEDEYLRYSLLLVTPETDREGLSARLLQLQLNERTDEPARADMDIDDSEEEEEERHCPTRTHCTALMLAAALGDAELIQTLLSNGAEPNHRDSENNTVLMIAACHGHTRAVRALLRDHRTRVNMNNRYGDNALSQAAAQGNVEIFSLLLGVGSAYIERQQEVSTYKHPMLLAASRGHYPICKLLLNEGLDIDLHNDRGYTALCFAVESGQIECCRQLIDAGANVNHVTSNGVSVVYLAVRTGNLGIFDMLLEKGALLTDGTEPRSLLGIALMHSHADMVKRLIELKVDINAIHGGETALHIACQFNNVKAAEALLDAGAIPDIPNSKGWNGLVYAAMHGNVDLMRVLLKHGAKLRSKWHFGYLALYEATRCGKLDAMKFLLAAKAPVLIPGDIRRDKQLSSPLLTLVMNPSTFTSDDSQFNALDLLLTHGADWREVDENANDVLMRATEYEDLRLILRLLEAGATIGQINAAGYNALEIAAQRVDKVMSGTYGPLAGYEFYNIQSLQVLIQGAKRQPNWYFLRTSAIYKAQHLLTREILYQAATQDDLLLMKKKFLSFDSLGTTYPFLVDIVAYSCQSATDDWDRTLTEIGFASAGMPAPAIDFFCSYIKAFPAMKVQLFGPTPTAELTTEVWAGFVDGISACMEKMLFDEYAIGGAYESMGWDLLRKNLEEIAHKKISDVSAHAFTMQLPLQQVFADLFDDCLHSTLSAQTSQKLQLEILPAAGIIAAELMHRRVYAALAEGIEKAWREAWYETVNTGPVSSSSSSSSSSNTISASAETPVWLASVSGASSNINGNQLSEQQSSALMSAFRKALVTNIDSATLLKLPGASVEEAGLYADLMHRQLHMLAQFIYGQTETDVAPVPAAVAAPTSIPVQAPATAPATPPGHPPEFADLISSDDLSFLEYLPGYEDDF